MKTPLHEIKPNLQIVDNQPILLLEDINSLVIADLHLGVEAIMQEEGSFVPHNLTTQIIESLTEYIKDLKPDKLILNGDVKHSFQEPTKIENRDVKKFLKKISSLVPEVHIVKGNHDVFLSWAIQNIENIFLHSSSFSIKGYYFVHGDKKLEDIPAEEIEYIIIGHLHPVFESRVDGLQKVRNPTFLVGPLEEMSQTLIVMPAFTKYSSGSPIDPKSQSHYIVPILREYADLQNYELYVLGENDVFHFPELKLWM
ncbi:MAG: metallophosphoesterase [Candidatus Heimdallarchaeota archaeon]|nr:metallophosphoesterase [Candidatus Heimdallarchaeota archaeon]